MRFENTHGTPLGDVLPGYLFERFRGAFRKIVNLPTVNIPRVIAQQDAQLRYLPTVRLEGGHGDFAPLALQAGERVVSLNCGRPYIGWARFRQRIEEVARALQEFGLIDRPQRLSLRYLDLIDLEPQPSLKGLEAHLRLGEHELTGHPVHLRTELREEGLISIVQIVSATEAKISPSQSLSGVLIDIDVICEAGDGFWEKFGDRLEHIHDRSKRLFFSLLAQETIARLDPVYD